MRSIEVTLHIGLVGVYAGLGRSLEVADKSGRFRIIRPGEFRKNIKGLVVGSGNLNTEYSLPAARKWVCEEVMEAEPVEHVFLGIENLFLSGAPIYSRELGWLPQASERAFRLASIFAEYNTTILIVVQDYESWIARLPEKHQPKAISLVRSGVYPLWAPVINHIVERTPWVRASILALAGRERFSMAHKQFFFGRHAPNLTIGSDVVGASEFRHDQFFTDSELEKLDDAYTLDLERLREMPNVKFVEG